MTKPLLCTAWTLLLTLPGLAQAPVAGTPQPPAPPAASARVKAVAPLNPADLYQDILAVEGKDDSLAAKTVAAKKSGDQTAGPTVIHARDSVYTPQLHQAVFEHKVVVNNATFNVICDKLTAFLRHGEPGKPRTAAPTPTPSGNPRKAPLAAPGNGAIDRALAEGNVQVTQDKVDDSGNITHSIGRGQRMTYEEATGKITLYGKPDIQQGNQTCVALAESTIMILNRNGTMEAIGPHKTVITEPEQDSDGAGAKPAAAR